MHASTLQSTAHRFKLGCRWSSTAAPKRATAALPCQSKSNSKAARANSTSSQSNKSSVRQRTVQANERQTASGFQAGPAEEAPSYTSIDAALLNKGIMALFRQKMVDAIGQDSQETGYAGIIDLTRKLNAKYRHARQTQEATKTILRSLFPSWLPGAFKVMFSKPVPHLSNRLNAWVTALTCQWLMGPSKVTDVELPSGQVLPQQGVLVERCRYLEEAGCASICINSCKVPTQEFFQEDMGLMLTMTPNYEDFSCQFNFGQTPEPQDQDEAFMTPCFQQCPSKRQRSSLNQCHDVQTGTQSNKL